MNNKLFNWYMVSTVSGKEDKVKEALETKIKSQPEIAEMYEEVYIFKAPHLSPRDLEKKRAGEKYTVKMNNIYKGYIFIRMQMTDETWFLVRNTQYVTGLIGSSGKGTKPTPISDAKFKKMLENEVRLAKDFEVSASKSEFFQGVFVEITDGPFLGESGMVIESDDDNRIAVVELEIFGKKTPTQLDHTVLKVK
ncbi:transcription termination/antitermination protein NusG [Mycoplasma iguanae]|uniref:Transcription termination/antitermination protein NusG n=1 Tax=Mycoplasma iguanae TaxID=292461 RepID=A0ABY5RBH8_9MOLU|nr:transcription termination/antitermination protein NusG [Mycoplasma iguanae]UVD81960.1 transcription termination/antitermination protein NusG [Mycoplasma iguanae]